MANLVRRVALNRDADAFRELFETYAPRVKSYMIRHGADAATAEELAQETLLAVWRKAALYEQGKGSTSTWIFTIARNLRIDRLRKEAPWQELPKGYAEEACEDAPPDEAASEEERGARVKAALKALPPDQYEVIQLSYLAGLSHGQIAARLGLPLGTVKSRMRLAYLKVRSAVEDLR